MKGSNWIPAHVLPGKIIFSLKNEVSKLDWLILLSYNTEHRGKNNINVLKNILFLIKDNYLKNKITD